MTSTKTRASSDRATKFLKAIQGSIAKDNGAKAALKRALTGEARHLRAVYPLVLPMLGGIEYNQDEWIFVACLFAFYPQSIEGKQHNFGVSARYLASATHSEGADRRFRSLLDTSLEDLRSPLGAMVRLMKSKSIGISYPKLIVDLCKWEHPDQYIQDDWARTFWGVANDDFQAAAETIDDSTEDPTDI